MSIVFVEKTIRLRERCPELEILHLSDLHLRGPRPALERALRNRASKKTYDLVFLTGDLVDDKGGIAPFLEYVSLVRARYGMFAVWGNHDALQLGMRHNFIFKQESIFRIPENNFIGELKEKMSKAGISILSDELRSVEVAGQHVYIAGLDNMLGADRLQNWRFYAERINKIRDFLGAIPEGSLTIAITHLPDIIEKLDNGTVHVMFAGHTHGGQIRLPFLGPLWVWSSFQRKYNRGLYDYNGTSLYISSGLGAGRFMPRFRCPPEISVVKIKGGP